MTSSKQKLLSELIYYGIVPDIVDIICLCRAYTELHVLQLFTKTEVFKHLRAVLVHFMDLLFDISRIVLEIPYRIESFTITILLT